MVNCVIKKIRIKTNRKMANNKKLHKNKIMKIKNSKKFLEIRKLIQIFLNYRKIMRWSNQFTIIMLQINIKILTVKNKRKCIAITITTTITITTIVIIIINSNNYQQINILKKNLPAIIMILIITLSKLKIFQNRIC